MCRGTRADSEKAHLVLIGIMSRNMSRLFQSHLESGRAQADVPWWSQKFCVWLQMHQNGCPRSYLRLRKVYKLWFSMDSADPLLVLWMEAVQCNLQCNSHHTPQNSHLPEELLCCVPTDVACLCFHAARSLSSQAMWISEHWLGTSHQITQIIMTLSQWALQSLFPIRNNGLAALG